MDTRKEELELIDIQTIVAWVLIGSLIVSLIIAHNSRLELEGNNPFWTAEEVRTITIWTRWVVLIAAILAIYINYRLLEIQKTKNTDQKDIDAVTLEFWASILAAIAATIILVAVSEANLGNELINIDNPEL